MTELETMLNKSNTLSTGSVDTYIKTYNKLRNLIDKDIIDTSQKKILSVIDTFKNINTQQTLINIAIKIRDAYGFSYEDLLNQRHKNKLKILEHIKDKNKSILEEDNLPSLNKIYDFINSLYDNKLWVYYIINYLLIHYYVRNEDLNIKFVLRLKDTKLDKEHNYLWLDLRRRKVVFIRNKYKTAKTYGQKKHTIYDDKFIFALIEVIKTKQRDEPLIPVENIGYHVKKATYNEIGETMYLKILIKHNQNDLNMIKEISQSRGTSINTLINNYNLNLL